DRSRPIARRRPQTAQTMYGADIREILRHSVTYVNRILRGARPQDLPVEQPCCANAANGHATLAPMRAMNSRRLIVSPVTRSPRQRALTTSEAVISSPQETGRLLEAAPGPKYKAAMSAAYSAGLRVSEVVALKVADRSHSIARNVTFSDRLHIGIAHL